MLIHLFCGQKHVAWLESKHKIYFSIFAISVAIKNNDATSGLQLIPFRQKGFILSQSKYRARG